MEISNKFYQGKAASGHGFDYKTAVQFPLCSTFQQRALGNCYTREMEGEKVMWWVLLTHLWTKQGGGRTLGKKISSGGLVAWTWDKNSGQEVGGHIKKC